LHDVVLPERFAMARHPHPWYRKDRDAWYVTVGGKRIKLADGKANRKAALAAFHKLMVGTPSSTESGGGFTTEEVVSLFLGCVRSLVTARTLENYEGKLRSFAERWPTLLACEAQPMHVTEWLADHPNWNSTTRFNAVTSVKRCWKWAFDEGRIAVNHISKCKKPTPNTRATIPDPKGVQAMLDGILSPYFRDLMTFLYETGCRPSEAMRLTAQDLELDEGSRIARICGKTTRKTGRLRIIYMSDKATEIVKRLSEKYPRGLLFRNEDGNEWNRFAVNCQMIRLRRRTGLGSEAVAYALRHHWITDALARGVPIKTVAQLAGHSSTAMIDRVYSHLVDRQSVLQEAADLVRPNHPA
jgi:integrase